MHYVRRAHRHGLRSRRSAPDLLQQGKPEHDVHNLRRSARHLLDRCRRRQQGKGRSKIKTDTF